MLVLVVKELLGNLRSWEGGCGLSTGQRLYDIEWRPTVRIGIWLHTHVVLWRTVVTCEFQCVTTTYFALSCRRTLCSKTKRKRLHASFPGIGHLCGSAHHCWPWCWWCLWWGGEQMLAVAAAVRKRCPASSLSLFISNAAPNVYFLFIVMKRPSSLLIV